MKFPDDYTSEDFVQVKVREGTEYSGDVVLIRTHVEGLDHEFEFTSREAVAFAQAVLKASQKVTI